MNLVLLGAPGSGKGTQSEFIEKEFDVVQVSTGNLFRDNVKRKTPLGLEAEKYMNEGNLVPDKVVENMLADKLNELASKNQGFMLDGFPRTLKQAEFLHNYMKNAGLNLDHVLYLSVPDEEIIKRLSKRMTCKSCGKIHNQDYKVCPECGGELYKRDDDNEETIKKRLNVFHENNSELLKFYSEKGLLIEIKALGNIDDIFAEIKRKLI